jgi:membrane protein
VAAEAGVPAREGLSPEPSRRSGLLGGYDRVQAVVRTRWRRERARRPWLDHLARAYRRYKDTHGDHLAAGITYFSFLALFPMALLGISIAAFVLIRHPHLVQDLTDSIKQNVPGELGSQFTDVVKSSLDRRGTIGVFALLGVAYAGLGWIANLRTGIQIVWACEKTEENPIRAKLEDLLALVGLGLGILVSLTLTAVGTAVAGKLIDIVGLTGTPGVGTGLALITILLAVATDTVVFAWLLVRLPRRPVRLRSALRGALFAAVGYEALKLGGTFYLARVGSNGAYGAFVGAAGLLVWIDLVSRFLLFSAAWTATAPQPPAPDACPHPPEPRPSVSIAADGAESGRAVAPALAPVPHPVPGAVPQPVPGPGVEPLREPVAGPGGDGRAAASPGGRRNGSLPTGAVAGVLVGAGAALGAAAATIGHRLLRPRP